jgi:hypothetical protein
MGYLYHFCIIAGVAGGTFCYSIKYVENCFVIILLVIIIVTLLFYIIIIVIIILLVLYIK